MIKTVFLLLCVLVTHTTLNAQESVTVKKTSLRLSTGNFRLPKPSSELQGIGEPMIPLNSRAGRTMGWGGELAFHFGKRHDLGAYMTYATYTRYDGINNFEIAGNSYWSYMILPKSKALHYGLQYRYYFLFFGELHQTRLNTYALAKVGFTSEHYYYLTSFDGSGIINHENLERTWSKPFFETSAGIGLEYKFFRSFGVFTELSAGRFYNNQHFRWNTGISIHF